MWLIRPHSIVPQSLPVRNTHISTIKPFRSSIIYISLPALRQPSSHLFPKLSYLVLPLHRLVSVGNRLHSLGPELVATSQLSTPWGCQHFGRRSSDRASTNHSPASMSKPFTTNITKHLPREMQVTTQRTTSTQSTTPTITYSRPRTPGPNDTLHLHLAFIVLPQSRTNAKVFGSHLR